MNASDKSKRPVCWRLIGILAVVLAIAQPARSAVIFRANFDLGAQNPAPSSYHPGGLGDVLPAGSTSVVCDSPSIALPSGFQGGQALTQTNGAAAPIVQGYSFNNLTNVSSSRFVQRTFTIEAVIRPDFSDTVYNGTNYGKTTASTIVGGMMYGASYWNHLFVDQTTRKVRWLGYAAVGDMTSYGTLEEGRWYHIAVVVYGSGTGSNNTITLYINNVADAAGWYPGGPEGWDIQNIFHIGSNLRIGNNSDLGNNFCGQIDAVAISDTALSPGSWALPWHTPDSSGVVFQANFDLANQSPAPKTYNPGSAGDILPQGSSGVRFDTNNAIVQGGGMQGKGAFSMAGGGAAPNVQGYEFWDVSINKLVQNTFTLEAIVKPDFSDAIVNGTNYGKASTSYILANNYPNMCPLYVDQQTGQVHFRGYTGYGDIDSSMTLTSGQWYHIAVVVDGGTIQTRMYINGQHKGTGNYPDGWQTQGIYHVLQHLFVGTYDGSTTGKNFCGQIDAVAISDSARSPSNFVLPYHYPPAGTIVKVR